MYFGTSGIKNKDDLWTQEQIMDLLRDELASPAEAYRVKKALRELLKLELVTRDKVSTGSSGSQPWGYRILTDGRCIVRPPAAAIAVALRSFRPHPVEEAVFIDHASREALLENERVLSEPEIKQVVDDCCFSEYFKRDTRSRLSPAPKLHSHFYYLSLLASHATRKKSPAAEGRERPAENSGGQSLR
jgi:hypothetical protein